MTTLFIVVLIAAVATAAFRKRKSN